MGYALCRRPLTIAHCFKIADSLHNCKRILDYRCPNLPFGMPGASTLSPVIKAPEELGSTRRETLGCQPWIFADLRGISGPPFWSCWLSLNNNCVFRHACLQVSLFKDFGIRIWMSGAPESSIWCGRYCKNQLFAYVGIMSILVLFLHGFRWLWDQFWWLLVAWRQAWNFMILSWGL